ncbi:tRNA (adenosine(37)-N6)-threonylcarbamoyltransferase complex ATPase subunit type 1 TsaE [Chlamydia sp.]|uniref:tRNA (adenosine(37)-N6)-threonylcarbamoyltransferase complex ATPase subunit type 1 TsaE n=1 Tax=Chlamydia sp. TaxID=35827 RepID=UPI0025BCAB8B|nr:tRNA (adenosine(37)-N6)-threonylcarbamoyltransferase complex ATPase subunit type 1 TsaE [Chlamydia sp.]MBQ8498969.1 tRNA (adenosine(37)-N6)-threonylcarbamoyltransferase complex ATPase subunit type 1 TsaE [Chlamydia sp.]
MGRYRRVTNSYEETIDLAATFGRHLAPGMVVLLSGDYGSGKTEFVRGIVQGFLGEAAASQVASPSFALLHVYESNRQKVCHYDLYRLEMMHVKSVESLFQDAEEEDLICIEWPEAVNLLPQFRKSFCVRMRFLTVAQREVIIEVAEDCDLSFFMEKD